MAKLVRLCFPVLLLGCLLAVVLSQVSAVGDDSFGDISSEDFSDDGLDGFDEGGAGDFGADEGDEGFGDEEEGSWDEDEEGGDVDDKDVVLLTASNFSSVVSENEHVLVAFTASWCGHCKSLAPKYAAAATQLKAEGSNIVLAKCDAATETSLAEKYNVEGFPTLYFFINGKETSYGGGRESDEIVAWLKKKTGPPAVTVETEIQAKDLLESEDVLGAGYFSKLEGAAWDAFQAVAREQERVTFVQFTDASLAPLFHFPRASSPPAFAIVKKDTDNFIPFEGEFASEALNTFVGENKLPLVITFSTETADQIFDSEIKYQVILFAKPKEAEELSSIYRDAAKSFKGKMIFVLVDTGNEEDSQSVVEFFGVDPAEPAVMAFCAEKTGSKFSYEGSITTEGLKTFVDGILTKKIKPHYKSDPLPEKNDEDVTVVVGKNFDDIVLDKTKDVLLEIYAPWCGHCQELEPTYKKLGAAFKGVESVVIAKMDGTTNEHELAPVEGFPTLLFFAADNKENTTTVSSGRSLRALASYLKKNAAIKFTLPESVEKELGEDGGKGDNGAEEGDGDEVDEETVPFEKDEL